MSVFATVVFILLACILLGYLGGVVIRIADKLDDIWLTLDNIYHTLEYESQAREDEAEAVPQSEGTK